MFLQKAMIALFGLSFLLPIHAEQTDTAGAVVGDTGQDTTDSALEQRIREHRESVDQSMQVQVPQDDVQLDPAIVQREEERRQRQEAARARYQKRMEAVRKQREERAALAGKWHEAERKYHEAEMETLLKQQEDAQRQAEQRHERLRNRAEEEHNYLVQHHEEMLEKALQSKIDFANRQEEMRKQAEERRKKVAAFRTAMKDMTAEERREYMEKHRDELFSQGSATRPRGELRPQRYGAMRRSPPPPWFQQAPAPVMPQE